MLIVQTPLRISFLGGGTDLEDFYSDHGGAVLSAAIDKYVFVIVKERFDELVYVNYSKKEIVDSVDRLEHDLVREAMKMAGVAGGLEVTTLADVPSEGTGLGSSSSITVGLLQAFYGYRGEFKTAGDLAQEACQIEIDLLGKPIGRQDQYIAAYGNMRFFQFNSHGVQIEDVSLAPEEKRRLNEHLMLFYTGMTRKSDPILTEQKANIADRVAVLREMTGLAADGRRALVAGELREFGEMLHRGWRLKKHLASGITNPAIEEMYQTALDAGAVGGKITGAGAGGFLLLYCAPERKEDVRRALRGLRELPFHFEHDGTKVIFNYRRSS
jgi:D-glycero-alpha-D-manno-heptose-7-phosphate kinase